MQRKSSHITRTEPSQERSPSISDDEEEDYEQIKKEMILEIPKIKKKINIVIERAASALEEINELYVFLAASIKEKKC